ncbi:glycine cleavage system H protein [Candidatus Endolissoclinum faulkneri L2]|uniref:Glycine cleavage system H protein n=1 Tax=Candidatus Endolissoclinum faulkneri L2 TaxID=1193729 RepID=K7YNM8_9PROT|nr:glycine cleavage system H protein [Candidatus Endolissoclinum faulkneri L2]
MFVKYTKDHEWISINNDIGTIGITDHAQKHLGDIVFVELPNLYKIIAKGDEACVIESVKVASEIYAPVSGEIIEINEILGNTPSIINMDPLYEGWIFKIKMSNTEEINTLMDEIAYRNFTS